MVIVQVKVTYRHPEFPPPFYLRNDGQRRTAFSPTLDQDVLLCRLRWRPNHGERTENSLVDRLFRLEVAALHKKTTIRSN